MGIKDYFLKKRSDFIYLLRLPCCLYLFHFVLDTLGCTVLLMHDFKVCASRLSLGCRILSATTTVSHSDCSCRFCCWRDCVDGAFAIDCSECTGYRHQITLACSQQLWPRKRKSRRVYLSPRDCNIDASGCQNARAKVDAKWREAATGERDILL